MYRKKQGKINFSILMIVFLKVFDQKKELFYFQPIAQEEEEKKKKSFQKNCVEKFVLLKQLPLPHQVLINQRNFI